MKKLMFLVVLLAVTSSVDVVRAQNPVQWNGNVQQAVARAREQKLPLLFWVSGGNKDDDDDLSDAQSDCFRDPIVVETVHSKFVPVRVSRNSRVLEEASKLGLPTTHGLYCAVITADGRLIDQMGPDVVARPAAFQSQLMSAFTRYSDELYDKELRPLLENLSTPKEQARTAVQTVYRLAIRHADKDVIKLLDRKDVTAGERSRLYGLIAFLGTELCIKTLLDKCEEPTAVDALRKADLGALQYLLPELPAAEGPVTPRQYAAYQGSWQICRLAAPRARDWWGRAKPEERKQELDRVRARADAVLEYWRQAQGGQ